MDTLLHGKLGKILGEDLNRRGYNINVGYFIYGSMLPDISPFYRFSMHTKETNYTDVIKLMKDLVIGNDKLTVRSISIKLGMLNHYLCDFFTFPHNRGFKESIIQHELYEQVQRIVLWSKLQKIWNKYSEEAKIKLRTFEEIIMYIEDMHLIYNNNLSNRERDIYFMSILSRVVSSSLLDLRRKCSSDIETKVENIKVSCL
ncbi:zinc dependent phospholipase C family protein [Clostridium cibarium]|uniref:Zinc dependent phospholipase C family protein n=1 Tax=Clostridium cibarium TaxID=2762247 RepID=A0ABR8PQS2_9CLOT|nr:zinc dependent phospholipase C family protein [Clostridium cibarium]MBD7910529.1 zinc dependent phospholipase C family protein [Clostridium cibarium]